MKKSRKSEKKRLRNTIISVLAILLVLIVIFFANFIQQNRTSQEISSFQECAEQGYIVMESYPRQCRTPRGDLFIEETTGQAVNFAEITNALINPNFQEKKELVLNDEDAFKEIFQDNPLYIDFNKRRVIAVFSGEKSTGGHSIQVRRIQETEDSLNIYVLEKSAGSNCMVTQVITYPFTAIEISKSNQKIEFFYESEVQSC